MADEATTNTDHDLDEDLFDFGSIGGDDWHDDDADLDEIFAAFEAEEASIATEELDEELARDLESIDDELPGDDDFAGLDRGDEPPGPLPAAAAESAPTPLSAPSPDELAHAGQPQPQAQAAATAPGAPPPLYYQGMPQAVVVPQMAAGVPVGNAGASNGGGLLASPGLRAAAWILIAITCVNALVALVSLKSTGDLQRSVETVGQQVTESTSNLVREAVLSAAAAGETAAFVDPRSPISAPDPENHPTFEIAREEIQRGEFDRARQRLYALLAIIDRLDPLVREEIEARANYLLAHAVHMQSLQRWETRR